MQLLAYPFQLRGGAVPTVTQGTDAEAVDAVARIALTRIGELPLVPSYGVPDPVFSHLTAASINATLALHGPTDVTVTVANVVTNERDERITLVVERSA